MEFKNFDLLPPFKINFMMMSISESQNYGLKMHNIPEEWKKTKGEGIKIGLIDTGLPIHRDLNNQICEVNNFTKDPVEDMVVGHSSHCAGITCGEENGEGVVGIAPKAKLVIAKALGDNGSGNDRDLARAIEWTSNQGVQIINMSLGAPYWAASYFPQTYKAIKEAYEKNIVIVCASGNENANKVGVPARYKECIAVGAVNEKMKRASFSNKGPSLDFMASGVNIISTYINNSFASLNGTSMAAPQISGIVALMLSEHQGDKERRTPINNVQDVVDHLKKICIDLGDTGFDNEYGFGLPIFGEVPVKPYVPKKTLLQKILPFL